MSARKPTTTPESTLDTFEGMLADLDVSPFDREHLTSMTGHLRTYLTRSQERAVKARAKAAKAEAPVDESEDAAA